MPARSREVDVEVHYKKCAGLDVHKASVVACTRIETDKSVEYQVQTFGTTTAGLLALVAWLVSFGCTHVAMEATGVYWMPVWHVLEGTFQLVLANAAQIKGINRPKTDKCDARWIADLLAHNLIRASFVPPQRIQELRKLTRTRTQFQNDKTRQIARIQKTLEDANIKLDDVLSDVVGTSGRAMLRALIEGETDPEKLATLAHRQVRAARAELVSALRGRVTDTHRLLLKVHLDQVEAIEAIIETIDEKLNAALEPYRTDIQNLRTIPGVGEATAQIILSEIGSDMSVFPTPAHLVSWARVCPRNDESAGKRQSTRVRKGQRWLKPALVQVVLGAVRRKKPNYLKAQYHRLKSRRGPQKAKIAVAASVLTAVYYVLRDKVPYRDLGPEHFDKIASARTIEHLVKRLKSLGVDVAPLNLGAANKEQAAVPEQAVA
jgi:transposase